MRLDGKVALITGAGSPEGIGLATAKLFAAEGATTALIDIEEAPLQAAGEAMGAPHRTYLCDVADAGQCRDTVAAVAADLGRIDILINNAGLVRGTPILDISEAEWDQVQDVNVKGNFLMAQAAVPHLKETRGAIVCISSIAGQNGGGVFGRSHYAASNAGIMGLAKALGRELAPDGVRCNAIAVGPVDNDFTRGAMTREIKDRIAGQIPLGRLGTSEEIAQCCLFLASDMASFVTGSVLDANGGLLIH